MITNDINNFKNFKDDIEKITEYQKLIEIFLTTKDIKKLIQTARLLIENKNKLKTISVNLDLSSLSWMNHLIQRIFEIKKIGKISIIDNSIRFDLLNNFEFNFVPANMNKKGFYLRESNLVLNIFYFDIFTQRLFFDASGLAKIFTSNTSQFLNEDDVSAFVKMMNVFADVLLEDEFALDLNLIDYENDQILYVDKVDVPADVSDKLFIAATKNDVYVGSLNNGFSFDLDNDVTLFFTVDIDKGGHSQWQFRVTDKKNEWSFLQVLQKYHFIGNWYVNNLKYVEVAYRDEIFIA